MRRSIREQGGEPSSRQVGELLDGRRTALRGGSHMTHMTEDANTPAATEVGCKLAGKPLLLRVVWSR